MSFCLTKVWPSLVFKLSKDFPSRMREDVVFLQKSTEDTLFCWVVHTVVCFGIVLLTGCWLVCEMATPCPLSSVQFEGSNLGTPRWKRETRRPSWTLALEAALAALLRLCRDSEQSQKISPSASGSEAPSSLLSKYAFYTWLV